MAPANRLPHHDTGVAGRRWRGAAAAMRECLNPYVNTSVLQRLDTQIHLRGHTNTPHTHVDTQIHLCPRVEAYQPNQQGRVGRCRQSDSQIGLFPMLSALAKRVHSHALHAPRLRISTLGAVGTRKSEDCDRWHLAVEFSMAKQQRLELASV
jgi:hypothetical protein